MKFPINAFHDFGLDGGLLLSLLIGVGFGFMLERGGFGSSKVLAGIFYGRDWRVLKVMFSAIVTAMVGLYAADGLGLVAMDRIAFKSTYLWGQVAGGLLLGVGFVTAGYCPGTSVVGAVSGKLDALFVMLGLFLGIGVFEEAYPLLAGFYESGYLGEVSVPEWLGLPAGAVVLLVVAVAIGAFSLVALFERRRSGRRLRLATLGQAASVLVAGVLVLAAQSLGAGSARAMTNETAAGAVPTIEPLELAALAVEGRADYLVLDLREEEARPPLPGSVHVTASDLLDLRRRPDLPGDRLLVVADAFDGWPGREVVASLRASGLEAALLVGGTLAWSDEVLAETAADARARAYRLLVSGESVFGGAPPPPPKKAGAAPTRKKKKSSSCS